MANKLKSAEEMPGSFGLPLIGETLELSKKLELFHWERYWKHGTCFKTAFLGSKFAYLIHPNANRLVLVEQADRLSNRMGMKILEPILSNDVLLLQDGEEHRTNRKMLLPVFHHQAIVGYFGTIQSIVTSTIAAWGKQESIDLDAEFRKLTLAIVVKIFLGTESPKEINRVSEWYTTLLAGRLALLKWDLPLTLYGRSQAARRQIIDYIRQIIQQRIERGDLETSTDALGLLLNVTDESGNKLTEMQVINHSIGLLFAGHETTSTLMNWIVFELGNHPEWRDKLRQELQQVIGNEPITIAHLRQLPQMSNVIKEGERLYPPANNLIRGVVKEIEYGGYRIPAGWNVIISPHLTQRMPEFYREPDTFDPDRFAPPREEDKKHPFALTGFGGGNHFCLGVELAQMEMKLILATLLQNYDWTVTPTAAEIAPVLQHISTQGQLRAKFVPLDRSAESIKI